MYEARKLCWGAQPADIQQVHVLFQRFANTEPRICGTWRLLVYWPEPVMRLFEMTYPAGGQAVGAPAQLKRTASTGPSCAQVSRCWNMYRERELPNISQTDERTRPENSQ